MSNQIQITGGAKVRNLEGVITGSTGVLSSVPLGGANGVATLDSGGKVPVSQLPSSVVTYLGTWNAATNTPTLANGTGDAGDMYICNVAGTVNFGAGPITFAVGDWVLYGSGTWQKSNGQNGTVTSVAASITGNSIGITGSPISTAGTLAFAFAGNSGQYINGAGNLVTFPTITTEATRLITEVYNETGATLSKGTVVYINGGHGNLPTVTKALATGDATSAQTYGVVQSDITDNNNGYVVVIGSLSDLDTQAYPDGTQLYLSGTTAGAWTSTKPYAPIHLVYVGIVTRSHPTQGVVEVKIQNGYEMDELHNVSAQSPSNNDGLFYNTSTSLWEAKSIASALGYTPANDANVVHLTGNETIGGTKTFSDATKNNGGILLQNGSSSTLAGYMNIGGLTNGVKFTSGGGISNTFTLPSSTGYTFTFPSSNGTIALLEGTQTISGNKTFSGTSLFTGSSTFDSALQATIGVILPMTGIVSNGSGVIGLGAYLGGLRTAFNGGYTSDLAFQMGANYVYTFPSASGTIALTSDLTGGTVTSVALSAPTGFSVTGSPVTTSGTLALAFASGYSLPTTAKQSNWDDAYTWVAAFPTQTGNSGKFLTTDGSTLSWAANPLGTVTSVAMTVPTGLSVSGSPITSSGTLAVTLTAGYSIPTTAKQTEWDTAYTNRITSATSPLSIASNVISISQASASSNGYLSSTDWSTFNGKIGGGGTANYIPKFSGTSSIADSIIYDNSGKVLINTTDSSIGHRLAVYSATEAAQLRVMGAAPSVLFTDTANASYTYSAYLGIVTSANNFFTGSAAGNYAIVNNTSNPIVFAINSSLKMTLNASGNLSIGNTNDTYKLDVTGTGRFSGNLTLGSTTTGVNANIYSSSYGSNGLFQAFGTDGNLKLQMGGLGTNEAFFYTGSGNKLTFYSGGAVSLTLASTGAATFSSSVTAKSNLTGTNTAFATNDSSGYGVGIGYVSGSYGYITSQGGSSPLVWAIDGTEKVRLTTSGNVGIGTTSPRTNLSLLTSGNNGSTNYITFNPSGNKGIELSQQSGTANFGNTIWFNNDELFAGIGGFRPSVSNWGTELRFFTHPDSTTNQYDITERMRISSSGDVNISTGQSNDAGARYLTIYGSGSIAGTVQVVNTWNGYNYTGGMYGSKGSNAACELLFKVGYFNGSAAAQRTSATFTENGNVYNYSNTTTWQTTSDIRVKENINTLSNALNIVLQLNPVTFDYKQEFADKYNWNDNKKINNIGFIAQEFEKVFPKFTYIKEEQFGNNIINDFRSIDTGHLVPYLVKGVQELKSEKDIEIAELKARIVILESKLS